MLEEDRQVPIFRYATHHPPLLQGVQGGLSKGVLQWLLIAAYHSLAYRCGISTTGCTENGTQEQADSQGERGSYEGVDVVEIHGKVIQL